jgi:amphi-Trp domain-containing protein
LADCIEQGKLFQIQVGGERISVPPTATINVEHERSDTLEELEFQLTWKPSPER